MNERHAGCALPQAPMTVGARLAMPPDRRGGASGSEQSELVEGPRLQGWWDDVKLKRAIHRRAMRGKPRVLLLTPNGV